MRTDNLKLLFEKNEKEKITVVKKNGKFGLHFTLRNCKVDGKKIAYLVSQVGYAIEKYKNTSVPVYFNLHNVIFMDKLTYVILECICYFLIKTFKIKVSFNMTNVKLYIANEGVINSPIYLIANGNTNIEGFVKKFNIDLYGQHYRKILKAEDNYNDALSKLLTDVKNFLRNLDVDLEYGREVSKVVSELAGNSMEHAKSDCLIDIDVTREYRKEDGKEKYVGINIVILNFSNKLFYEELKNKMKKTLVSSERYKLVEEAYNNHMKFFNNDYKESDFFSVASFQHKISGRVDTSATGGTGLTALISSLEKKADLHACYLLSGQRVINFQHEFLEYDENNWIGFNKENDFLNVRPDDDVFEKCAMFFPGTAYNLSFVICKEKGEVL